MIGSCLQVRKGPVGLRQAWASRASTAPVMVRPTAPQAAILSLTPSFVQYRSR